MKLFIDPIKDPELNAIEQAKYSRSLSSIQDRIKEIESETDIIKLKETLKKYYLSWNHASVGDLGDSTIFIEDVSLLLPQIIQDNQLYNGIECSTRYIDFSKSSFYHVSKEADNIIKQWFNLYNYTKPLIKEALEKEFPLTNEKDFVKRENFIESKSCDICRSLIPIAAKTNFSWKTSFRQIREYLLSLRYHPNKEAKDFSEKLYKKMCETYPYAFGDTSSFFKHKENFSVYNNFFYDNEEIFMKKVNSNGYDISYDYFNSEDFKEYIYHEDEIKYRIRFDKFSKNLNRFGNIIIDMQLDYGSFRDIHRHRNCSIPLPIVGLHLKNINQWYLDEFKKYLGDKYHDLENAINQILSDIEKLNLNIYEKQYVYPLGINVPITITTSISQLVYILELRSSKTVHPTLRKLIINIGKDIQQEFPSFLFYLDLEEDSEMKRGLQT